MPGGAGGGNAPEFISFKRFKIQIPSNASAGSKGPNQEEAWEQLAAPVVSKHRLIKHEQVSSSDKCELEGIDQVAHLKELFVPSILATVAVHKQACRKPVHKRPENGKQKTPSKKTHQKKRQKHYFRGYLSFLACGLCLTLTKAAPAYSST